ncbi:IS3 family transposase [Staphylococcus gallinarum]|uniref:IS3 family transposase n=1 Tax=Staphylococcus gallinarum TaxID=1293 RepID=UPI001300C99A
MLKNDIANIYKKYDDIYGYRHIYIYIRLRMKMLVNHKRVYRLMKSLGLKSMIR